MALYNKVLPPTIKVKQPIEPLRAAHSPFYVNTVMRPWLPRHEHPRRAALSAFGFGGSNFHAVLEEADCEKRQPDWDGSVEIVALSADTPQELRAELAKLPTEWNAFALAAEAARATFRSTAEYRLCLAAHRTHSDIRKLIDRGHLDQIVIAHDICHLSHFSAYGGWGYAHIFKRVVPRALKRGFTQDKTLYDWFDTVVNEYLVRDLKRLGLWDDVMVMDLKHFDGSLRRIDRVPEDLKQLYATAFEVETQWLVEAAARRQKWIDQAQSLNIYMAGASGKKLDETYKLAWVRGLKTTYYLRTIGATHAEKSTVSRSNLNAVSSHVGGGTGVAASSAPVAEVAASEPATDVKFCSIDNPDCEACQ